MNSDIHIHVFNDTVVPATCQEKGYTLHKCDCGYEHKDNFTPSEHAWDKWHVKEFPTRTEKGVLMRICSRCGQIEEQEVAVTGHKLTSKNESETQKGVAEYFCENCGQTISVPSVASKTRNFFAAHKKAIIVIAVLFVLAVGLFFATENYFIPAYHYSRATALIEEKSYNEAFSHLRKCKGFKDSNDLLEDFRVIFDKEIVTIYAKDGSVISKTEYEYQYDKYGNKTLEIRYDEGGNVAGKGEYEYDKYGNMTLYVSYDNYGNVTEKHECEYDKNGNMTLSVSYDNYGNVTDKFECEYDKNGNRTLSVSYDNYGNVTDKFEYEYDKHGNETLSIWYDEYGNVTRKYKYEYDKNGNMTLSVPYDKYGNVISKHEYEYDKHGNRTLSVSYDEDGNVISKHECGYDKNSNITFDVLYDEDGNVTDKFECEYEYDKYGNITLSVSYDKDGNVIGKYEYINPRVIYMP